ncbi:MAG: reverse transcriptase family protein [Candidatus Thiodiazotropha taylori]|nr:reverse transcriptase family protein [Candidatus Thiodiazotropha taylori]
MKGKLGRFKTQIQKEIRQSYWDYLESVILPNDTENCKNKKLYTYVKHKRTENFGIAPLKSEGITYTEPTQQATVLNTQFESAFSKPKALSLKILSELKLWYQGVNPKQVHQMPDIEISNSGIETLLKKLNPNKASGPDQISPRLLKELNHELAPILTKIFSCSLETGIVPDDWKTALVAPVYKKGPKHKPSNYRPISLTCISSKLMEHILVSNIMDHFDTHCLLNPFQHGFRSKHSCETQLIGFTQELFDNLEAGRQTDLIVMDFSKAFDKVDHNLLVYKLFNLGVNLKTVNWITSFLHNRTQTVVVEGKQSSAAPVLSGVPQGSVLGPSLFLAYINDLPDSLKSRARLFADDTIVYLTIKSPSDPEILQNDLHKLEKWEKDWSMEFNPEKCEVIRVSKKKNPILFPYKLHNVELKMTENAKYLGITFSQDLSWKTHIENISSKANNTLKFIKRNVKTQNQKVKETAYNTYVRPQLEYCSSVWHPWQKTLSYKIERVQRAAARYVVNDYDFTSSVTEILKTLNWQTLEQRRIQNSVIMFYKINHNLVAVDHHHLTESRNSNFLVPYSRTQYHLHSYFPRTIRYWNSLPYDVKASSSLVQFTAGLATIHY